MRRMAGAAALLTSIATGGAAGEGTPSPSPSSAASRARACRYLWSQQRADGGWHSATYALLRSGQALTPFVLHALLTAESAECPAPPASVERALAFLRRHVGADGQVGAADPDVLEYPNYATAYTLRVFVRAGAPGDAALVEGMRAALVRAQYGPASGFTEDAPAFGGWGFTGARTPGRSGHMDLSHTRKVLQALREAGGVDDAVFARAGVFLRLMQRHPSEPRPHPTPLAVPVDPAPGPRFDGGFFFSPVVLDANKGAVHVDERGAFHASYATATADGALALLAAGLAPDDPRVRAARDWLERNAAVEHPHGIPPGGPQAWGAALDYYHLAARAEAYAALGLSSHLPAIAQRLGPRQHPDGRFVNDAGHLMKEDDPLLATTLAVLALR